MFKLKPYINMVCGETSCEHIKLVQESYGDVTAVSVWALSGGFDSFEKDMSLDPEKGVCIDITVDNCIRYMADYRFSEWWCEPYFGTTFKNLPDDTQYLVIERTDGLYEVFVPVVNDEYKCIFEGKNEYEFTAKIFSWYDKLYRCEGLAFVHAVGANPLALTEKCVETALNILNNGVRMRKQRRYPKVFERLGWCSWDAMQIRVSQEGLLKKCEELKNKNIPVKWAIIDDMWAEIVPFNQYSYGEEHMDMINLMYASPLYSFEADPKRFPDGLEGCVKRIKEFGLEVGLWHPTTGYWGGIAPEGNAYKILREFLIKTESGRYVADWEQGKSYLYYKTMHDFFKKCGIDFMKIDNQSMVRRFYKGLAPVGRIAREYHSGMEASVGEHFDNAMINCMGMASEDIWSRSVSPISRCSNDFQPEKKEWFTKHILQCAYNSIFQGQFYWCDWDMWWTDDGQAEKNSLMRAISGGPIYISDKIERSRAEILKPLILSDGSILRCDRPAMPSFDCVTEDCRKSGKALKVQNTVGEYGVMAVLNIDENENSVSAEIGGKYIEGFASEEYAVYEYFSREVRILKYDEIFKITLSDSNDYKFYVFAPIQNGFAAIGRTDKYISPKTIKYVHNDEIVLVEDGEYAYIKDGQLCFSDTSCL